MKNEIYEKTLLHNDSFLIILMLTKEINGYFIWLYVENADGEGKSKVIANYTDSIPAIDAVVLWCNLGLSYVLEKIARYKDIDSFINEVING